MPATTAQDRLTGRAWAVLFVLCGAIFLEGIDVSMMGVALPSIRAELGLSTSELQWIVSAYVLSYGGFVLLGGRAADLLGRRRMFIGWLIVFLAFSGLGGFAHRRLGADRGPLRHRHRRRLHDTRRPVHHHHDLPGGPATQQGPARVRRYRGRRVLPRHGCGWSPHRPSTGAGSSSPRWSWRR